MLFYYTVVVLNSANAKHVPSRYIIYIYTRTVLDETRIWGTVCRLWKHYHPDGVYYNYAGCFTGPSRPTRSLFSINANAQAIDTKYSHGQKWEIWIYIMICSVDWLTSREALYSPVKDTCTCERRSMCHHEKRFLLQLF